MLDKIMAGLVLVASLALSGCASQTSPVGADYHIAQGAWTCQEPAVIGDVEQGDRADKLDADKVQQHRCTLNPVNWPAHVMRVDGKYAYVCDAFSRCTGDMVFCQYALIADIRDRQNRPADPAVLLKLAEQSSLQSLKPAEKAECSAQP
jgi:hypothetical protein